MTCPHCHGEGTKLVHLLYERGWGEWQQWPCFVCQGKGELTPAETRRIAAGRRRRRARLAAGRSLWEEAERLGTTVAELSRREAGREP